MQRASCHLVEWYGIPTVELSSEENKIAASLSWLLSGDAAQRALATWHMGWQSAWQVVGREWQTPFLAQLLDDPYASVRNVAFDSLQKLPAMDALEYSSFAPQIKRRRSILLAIELWRKEFHPSRNLSLASILFDHGLSKEKIEQLLNQQDKTSVMSMK